MSWLESLRLQSRPRSFWLGVSILASLALLVIIGLYLYAPVGVDWEVTYSQAARNWRDPYAGTTFTNPPWALIFLPHAFFNLRVGNAINMFMNIVVLLLVIRRFGGDHLTILMVFTSPFIIDLMRTNNIDWIPALGLLLPSTWGLLLLSVKPQSIGAVALIWWKQQRFGWRMFIPTTILFVISLLIYGLWMSRVAGLPDEAGLWNIAPFPFGVPLGLYILYLAYRSRDGDTGIILAAISTAFLTPYVAPYSLNTAMALGASRYRREAFIVWIATWIYLIYTVRRNTIMFGGM